MNDSIESLIDFLLELTIVQLPMLEYIENILLCRNVDTGSRIHLRFAFELINYKL